MRSPGLGSLIACVLFFNSLEPCAGALAPAHPGLPDWDSRRQPLPGANFPSDDQRATVTRLHSLLPGVQVEFDLVTGAPKYISNGSGFLSGTNGVGGAISPASLAGVAANDPHQVTKAFISEHRELFGYGPEALDRARIKREFETPRNGLRTVVWEQQVDGIPVFESLLISHTTHRGELVSISCQFVPDPEQSANHGVSNRAALVAAPNVSSRQAVLAAARDLGEQIEEEALVPVHDEETSTDRHQQFKAPIFKGNAEAKLIWLPMSRDKMKLCWDVIVMSRVRGEMFRELVDAQTGEPLLRRCLTDYLSEASYRVYTSDSPSPMSPGYSTPASTQPPSVARSLITTPALNTNASPAGWIGDGANETRGNNVDAHTDLNADNQPDLPRPQGSPFRVFDFPTDLGQAPDTYTDAAVVQLFYWNNFMHDELYELGFTEAAGNFQSNNFSRGGLGNDAVQADAQDGSGSNNANFSTPPDGLAGLMQAYVFTSPIPNRDGALDAEVILHEYTHGLSNRRVGGGIGISALQSRGMGEGWSDFYALSLLSEHEDDVNGVYAIGAYVSYMLAGLDQNYYFGLRRYPYCTSINKNPLTFKDIDPAQASSHSEIPRSPIVGYSASEIHNAGEVWCVTLWDARANLINKYGWAAGNELILQLVTDGMNLSPPNPNFIQARDAILQADLITTDGANANELWAAFAKRGMGMGATSPASSTTVGVHESYVIPGAINNFAWSATASPKFTNKPFDVTVIARDGLNNVASNFSGTVALTCAASNSPVILISPASSGSFTNGLWSGSITVPQRAHLASLRADDGSNHVGISTLFNVLEPDQPPIIYTQPLSHKAVVGGQTAFTVEADGANLLTYQWMFNGTNIDGATNASLSLVNLIFNNAGTYAMIVSNAYGSVLSSNTILSIVNVPEISAFSPAAAIPRRNVIISGQGFDAMPTNNVVYFGAVQAEVITSSVTNLVVAVPVGATYSRITIEVNGLTASALSPFLPTFSGDGRLDEFSLEAGANIATGSGSLQTAIGDLDGDGMPDLVVVNYYDATVGVYRNLSTNGTLLSASFASPVAFPAAADGGIHGLTLEDVNGDGRLDIVITDTNHNLISIFQNQSSPGILTSNSFAIRVDISVPEAPGMVIVADMDADGRPDLICTNPGTNTISILRNIGDGEAISSNSFTAPENFAVGAYPSSVAIVDMDGDGNPDVIIGNRKDSNHEVSVLRNLSVSGNIAFAAALDLAGFDTADTLAVADLDGDGRQDIIVGSYDGQTVTVYRNLTTPGILHNCSFAFPVMFAAGAKVQAIAISDLDGDGKPDLALVTDIGKLSLFKNTSAPSVFTTNSLSARLDFVTGNNPIGIAVGDLDGDGRPDIVLNNFDDDNLSIYRNLVPFATRPIIVSQPADHALGVGGTVSFFATVIGTAPLSNQWFWNETNLLAGATNTVLTMTNLQLHQSGTYSMLVSNVFGSTISSNAILVVTNVLDHFAWTLVSSLRFANTPFTVIVEARDPEDQIFTNFAGPVFFAATNDVPLKPALSANFVQGKWTGSIEVLQPSSNLVMRADDGCGHIGMANPINVVSLPSLAMVQSGGYLYVFWPVAASGFRLEFSSNLLFSQWFPVPAPPLQIGDQYLAPLRMTEGTQFYRLRYLKE